MSRITAIDSSRGLAVVLAMLGHAANQFMGQVEGIGAIQAIQLIFTRTATPTFMILFGIMIELVYLKRLRAGGPEDRVRLRLISRMLTCYVLFAAIALAAMITGKLMVQDTLEAVLFLGPGRFGNVLKIYTGLFLLIVLTLPWAIRWGSRFYLGLAVVAWALKYAFQAIGVPDLHLVHFIFGHATGFGPAILLGVTLVAYGLLIGEALSGYRRPGPAVLMLAAALGLLVFGVLSGDPVAFVMATITDYRWQNVPYYFAYGIVACSASLAGFWLLGRLLPGRDAAAPSTALSFETLGRDTLFYYGFGNIAINLLPVYDGSSPVIGYGLALGFLGALTAISMTRGQLFALGNRLFFGLPARLHAGYGQVISGLATRLARAG
ncbi:MAG: hypothetical protein AAF982_06115 [Pseudomonadota bacterium]